MNLHIENLAKVASADLVFDGITVIVGDNNTGKSTVGKALWAMFSAFANLEARVNGLRREKCADILGEFDRRFIGWRHTWDSNKMISALLDGSLEASAAVGKLMEMANEAQEVPKHDEWILRLNEVLSLTLEELRSQVVYNVLARMFNRQCVSFLCAGTRPVLELTVQQQKVRVEMTDSLPVIESEIALQHQAYYFDNPDLLSRMEAMPRWHYWQGREIEFSSDISVQIIDKYARKAKSDGNAIDDLLISKKFGEIERKLEDLMGGSIQYDPERGLQFRCQQFPSHPLRLGNLSEGLKAMGLLQAAFHSGAIGTDDVLILDEPEVHLHPEWQIRYAEFIVLLQKAFNLTILLTSHSPDFVQAIRLFSRKHGLTGRLNGYISRLNDDGSATMDPIENGGWDRAFEGFARSYDILTALRAEIGDPDDE